MVISNYIKIYRDYCEDAEDVLNALPLDMSMSCSLSVVGVMPNREDFHCKNGQMPYIWKVEIKINKQR